MSAVIESTGARVGVHTPEGFLGNAGLQVAYGADPARAGAAAGLLLNSAISILRRTVEYVEPDEQAAQYGAIHLLDVAEAILNGMEGA